MKLGNLRSYVMFMCHLLVPEASQICVKETPENRDRN